VPHDEVSELDGSVRPDFAIRVGGLITGHVELKAPGTSLDPASYGASTHNFRQWQRLRKLPNLLHTNGTEFRLWRSRRVVVAFAAPAARKAAQAGSRHALSGSAVLPTRAL